MPISELIARLQELQSLDPGTEIYVYDPDLREDENCHIPMLDKVADPELTHAVYVIQATGRR